MTVSVGWFDAAGIPQGSRSRMDDLSDVDTAEAKEGDTVQFKGGRWVPANGNEVSIASSIPLDQGVELWVNPDEGEEGQTADQKYINAIGDMMLGELNMNVPLWKGVRFTEPGGQTRVIGMRSTATTPGIGVHDGVGTLQPLGVGSPNLADHAATRGWVETNYLSVHAGRNNEANKLVRTNASGYIDVTYINTDAGVTTGNPTYVMAITGNDGYMRRLAPGYLQVDYAARTGTDGAVIRVSTVVMTTNASGGGVIDAGRPVAVPILVNGDFGAHPRAATCTTWSGNTFTFGNTNASQVIRINWMVS